MRLGVLDVGSNTVHLLVVDAHTGARPIPATSQKSVLRLMRYLEPDGSIGEVGVRAIIDAVVNAAAAAREADIDELLAFATSAIREATNGEAVLARITAEPQAWTCRCSRGEEEARLTFLAVRRWYGWSADEILLFDIGGGSLELAQGGDEMPDVARSVPLGAGRSTIEFLPDDPPTIEQVERLRKHARGVLAETLRAVARDPRAPTMSWARRRRSGHSRSSPEASRRASERRSAASSSGSALDDWIPRLARIPADARPALPGITEDRTFQIVAGAVVLSETMRAFKAKVLEVSPWALREGLILRRLDRLGWLATTPVRRERGAVPRRVGPRKMQCRQGLSWNTSSTASANAAIDGNSRSGVTDTRGSGVAPQPGRSWRRLIHTPGRPCFLAGTWSWNSDCGDMQKSVLRHVELADVVEEVVEVRVGGLVRADVLGGVDRVELDFQSLVAACEPCPVDVGEDDQLVVPLEPAECLGGVGECGPVRHGFAEGGRIGVGDHQAQVGPGPSECLLQHVRVEPARVLDLHSGFVL